jgi:hypothetical protein
MDSIEYELFGIKHKTQAINSKVKGNRGELEAVKLLSAWTGKKLKRVSWFVGGKGDVLSDDLKFDFNFTVEVKFYKNLGIGKSDPYIRANSCIYKFFNQCSQDAAASGKHPLLMVRENNMPKDLYYIFLPVNHFQHNVLIESIGARFLTKDKSMLGFLSDKFFERISFDTLKQLYQ